MLLFSIEPLHMLFLLLNMFFVLHLEEELLIPQAHANPDKSILSFR